MEPHPKPLFDVSLGDKVRFMRIKRGSFPIERFHKAKSFFESGMGVYVDHISENRKGGTVDFTYSEVPMPFVVDYSNEGNEFRSKTGFQVGETRSNEVFGDLIETPHLLVAGQTGGGKSNFVRGLITSLYQNNSDMDFALIDLKGGLEFQIFENLERVRVIPSVERAVKELKELQIELGRRMKLLKEKDVKDLDELQNLVGEQESREKTRCY